MEKINTPLMQSIERKKSKLKHFEGILEKETSEIKSLQYLEKVITLRDEIEEDESLLTAEREVIEKAFISGSANTVKERYSDKKLHLTPKFQDEKDYFTKNFKSYE